MGAHRQGRGSEGRDLSARFASVALVDHPKFTHTDRLFTYGIPPGVPVACGSVVRVRFAGRTHTGVVVDTPDASEVERVVDLTAVTGPGLPPESVDLARWVAERYLSTVPEALAAAVPDRVVSEEGEPVGGFDIPAAQEPDLAHYRNGDRLLRALAGHGGGFVWRPASDEDRAEIVARLCTLALARGAAALILVPEVRVEGEVSRALAARFGDGLARLGSDRSARDRYKQWLAVRSGAKRVAIGGRAAVFTPMRNLGLIVVDDEAHPAYKEGRAPRFHARAVAAERARRAGATVVFVGSPPSVEARAATDRGPYALVAASRARERSDRPAVTVVERDRGERLTPAARTLTMARDALASGRRVLVVTHRAGDALAAVAERTTRICKPAAPAVLAAESSAADIKRAVARADLICATPVLAKDLKLDGVGLVAIVDADAALAQREFRSAEEAFATWWRLGRSATGAAIAVETVDPSAPAIVALTRWDHDVLYRAEAASRRELGYPPFGALARVDVPAERDAEVAASLAAAAPEVQILGPARREDGTASIIVRARTRQALRSALAPHAAAWRAEGAAVRVDIDPWEVFVPKWRS